MKEEYGLFVWPSSIALAEYVWQQRSRFSGTSVVEVIRNSIFVGIKKEFSLYYDFEIVDVTCVVFSLLIICPKGAYFG